MKIVEAKTAEELIGILELQTDNLERNISKAELESQGFVTVEHDFETLKKISGNFYHIIAKDKENVVAYALVMLNEFGKAIPVLVPMFELIDDLSFKGQKLADTKYCVVGQVCVKKGFRGKGLFEKLYFKYFDQLRGQYDYVITEIASRNKRSLFAHAKVGFETIHEYESDLGEGWHIVLKELN